MCVTQARERIPYESLLRRGSSSSSVPTTPLKARPAWATSGLKPDGNTWQAGNSLQSSPVKTALGQPGHAAEEEDWPDLSNLTWEEGASGVVHAPSGISLRAAEFGQVDVDASYPSHAVGVKMNGLDVGDGLPHDTRQGRRNGSFGIDPPIVADQRLSKLQRLQERPRWGSRNALPFRTQGRAFADGPARQGQRQQSSFLSQSAHHSRLKSADTDEQLCQESGGVDVCQPGNSHPKKPLHCHVSLDSLIGHAERASPERPSVQPPHQPNSFRASIDERTADRIIQDDLLPKQVSVSQGQLDLRPSNRLGNNARYGEQDSAQLQPQSSQEWSLDSAKQSGEIDSGAVIVSEQNLPSFLSPTRSSEAKARQRSLTSTLSRSRHVATNAAAARGVHGQGVAGQGVSEEGTRSAPLTSTFRYAVTLCTALPFSCVLHKQTQTDRHKQSQVKGCIVCKVFLHRPFVQPCVLGVASCEMCSCIHSQHLQPSMCT